MSELVYRRPATLIGRSIRMSRRNIDALLTSLMLPVMLMLLFVYLFGGAINTGTKYVTYVVPGVLFLCAGFGASMTAVSVSHDMEGGVIDRFRSMDIGGTSVIAGHVVASVARNLVSTALVLALAFAIGFRPHASVAEWFAAIGILVFLILAISWFSAAIGLVARSPEAAGGFTFFVMFLPYPSSAFVPVATMPSWIRGFAGHQPVTVVVETVRGLLLDLPYRHSGGQAVLWCGGILLGSMVLSSVLFKLRTR
jgi:ABC-2 type transport system permease protein